MSETRPLLTRASQPIVVVTFAILTLVSLTLNWFLYARINTLAVASASSDVTVANRELVRTQDLYARVKALEEELAQLQAKEPAVLQTGVAVSPTLVPTGSR